MKRRDFVKVTGGAAALAAAGPFFHIRPARADKGELVVVSWGGEYDQALREAAFPAFEKATGFTVKLDAPPETAKVKAMVQSGNVSWDVILTDIPAVLTLMKDNLLEPLDYSGIGKEKLAHIPKELQRSHALGQRIYSFNIVYNTKELPKAKHPRDWAEVWDGKGFPGSRTFNFQGGIQPQLEVALLADGVPVDKLYPLDVERAWKMFDKLRPLVGKWYTSHAEAIQLISAGEAAVGCTIGPRGITAKHSGAPVERRVQPGQARLGQLVPRQGRARQEGGHGVHRLRRRRQGPGGDRQARALRPEQRRRLRVPLGGGGARPQHLAREHQAPVLAERGVVGGAGARRQDPARGPGRALRQMDGERVRVISPRRRRRCQG